MAFKKITLPALLFYILSHQALAAWEIKMRYNPTPPRETIFHQIVRWDENDDTRNPLLTCRNPMNQAGWRDDCIVSIAFSGGTTGFGWIDEVSFPEMSEIKTIGELARAFREKGLLNEKSILFGLNANTHRVCYGLQYHYRGLRSLMPGGVYKCNGIEIVPTYCSISELYIELNHGAISANAVNGHTVSRSVNASCNTDFKVRISAVDESGVLPLGSGLQSQLKVNGADLGEGYVDTVGPAGKRFTLSSTLSGYTSGTGNFQGSKVIILSMP